MKNKYLRENGYVMVWLPKNHRFWFMATAAKCPWGGYVREHRLVMAEHLNRPLSPNETIHHIDGDRANNDIANLELRLGNHGQGARYKCAQCGCTKLEPF